MTSRRRLVFTAGNLSVIDLFDNNAVAHDPRTQFLNWALTAHGTYDFAADARGYSWGAAIEYFYDDWALRAGRFMQPAESNGLPLDTRLGKHYGDQVELEHGHTLAGKPGKLRLLAFRNKANMGSFRDALADAPANGGVPDVARVRRERVKYGFGVNAEQNIGADLTLFGRASWNDGQTESYPFTEIERSVSVKARSRAAPGAGNATQWAWPWCATGCRRRTATTWRRAAWAPSSATAGWTTVPRPSLKSTTAWRRAAMPG
jgi:hypothetical protein